MHMKSTRAVALAFAALLLLTPPAVNAHPANEPTERTVIDAHLLVDPIARSAPCMLLDAGQLTTTTRVVASGTERRPATFWLTGYMSDPTTDINIRIRDTEVTQTQHIAGGRYCWRVDVNAPEAVGLSSAERGAYSQEVALRLTLTTP